MCVCIVTYICHNGVFLKILLPILPLFWATTCQYGPTEHVWNERAVLMNVVGHNVVIRTIGFRILYVSVMEERAVGLSRLLRTRRTRRALLSLLLAMPGSYPWVTQTQLFAFRQHC